MINALLCTQGCKLHASWDDDGDFIMRDDNVLGWLESPAWVNPSLPLSSLWLRSEGVSFDQEAERLCEVLSGGRDLDSVSLIVYKFGTHDSPIEISERCRQGLLSAKTLRIRSDEGCFLRVTGSNPCWEHLSIEACGDVDIEVPCKDALLYGLKDFSLYGKVATPLSVHFAVALTKRGDTCHVRTLGDHFCDVSSSFANMYYLTSVSEDRTLEFDEVMSCGCCACMLCLRKAGKVPEEFQVSLKQRSPFGDLQC